MKLGFTSTTFRRIKDLSKIVDIAKKSGVNCIEWGGNIHVTDINSAKNAKKLCDNAGIEISSYGSYYTVGSCEKEKWENLCIIAHTMNAKIIRVWLGKKASKKTCSEYYNKILSDLINICEIADKYGIIVSPECHTGTYNDNTEAFLKIQKDFKKKCNLNNLKTYFQSKYKNISYDLNRIEKTASEIEIVHLSYSERMKEQIFIKKDKDYIKKLLKKLKNCGYDKTYLLEFTYFASPSFIFKDIVRLKKELR